jgi:serine/threonine protein kinase
VLRFLRSQGALPLPFDDLSGTSPPSAFGTYRVLHQIGSGVLGPVFRAYDSQQDRLVAVKTFRLDLVPEDAVRLADRLRALATKLPAHPAIVGAVEAGLQGTRPYIALEYATGESLDVVMRQSGAVPLARALPILREIARAIDASWAVPVGHGSLHPRDIFVTAGTTDVRITGFGIGQALEGMGARAPVRRPYSAPERGTGLAWDARSDIYSFGAITTEM